MIKDKIREKGIGNECGLELDCFCVFGSTGAWDLAVKKEKTRGENVTSRKCCGGRLGL